MRRSCSWSIALAAAASLVACGETVSFTMPSSDALKPGIWGGDQAMLQVSAGEPATLELPCAHGSIPGPLEVQRDGRVEWPGRFASERPGPTRESDEDGDPATYRGTVTGETLTLDVLVAGREVVGRLTLTHGRRVRVVKCL
jgi:hypothetical protein